MQAKLFAFPVGFLLILLAMGCSQTTYKTTTYKRTVTTQVEITTNVPAKVWASGQDVGNTPITFPFSYEEEVDRQVTTANYWETNPGTAAALTVLSFGTYLPFSFIRAEPTSTPQPSGKFVGNSAILRLEAAGYEALEHVVECKGEPKIDLNLSLRPTEK